MVSTQRQGVSGTGALYSRFVGPLLASDEGADAEQLSQLTLTALGQASLRRGWPLVSGALAGLGAELQRHDPRLEQTLFGCRFANPVGLAAGFDKNAVAAGIWHLFGFGFAELGTITWHPQPGNPRPRLFRLAAERAALNRMGFNNAGAQAARLTLERQRLAPPGQRPAVLGINLGKSKLTSLELAPDDYASSLELLAPLADYAVVNVSSPNTPGLRDLQEDTQLRRLVERLRRLPQTGRTLAEEAGGLSGAPIRRRALEVLRRLRATAGPALPLIGVGGIDSAEAAWERMAAGASLVQLYTGWIYGGPELVPTILEGLARQLDRHGMVHIAQAVGSGLPWLA